jgi:hypothetical protein
MTTGGSKIVLGMPGMVFGWWLLLWNFLFTCMFEKSVYTLSIQKDRARVGFFGFLIGGL